MRSRFNHEGSLDPHADNEHELLRRAEEALERQRQEAQAAVATAHGARANAGAAPALTKPSSLPVSTPAMPHEAIAERLALKPTTSSPVLPNQGQGMPGLGIDKAQQATGWPVRNNSPTHSNAKTRVGIRRR